MLDILNEVSDVKTDRLFLIVLGSSGAGKSFVAGTAPGKTLYIHFDSERHGAASASKSGGSIIPICVDVAKDGKTRTADEAYSYGLKLLDPAALKKAGIETVVIDGMTELEKMVRSSTAWAAKCRIEKTGGHNSFAEPAATVEMMDAYIKAARRAQDMAGVHFVMTGILDVSEAEDNGAISVAKPRASGYSVAESIIQQFDDILTIGIVTGKDGKSGRVFQTGTDLTRVSTDDKKRVKRFINFHPRLAGAGDLPQFVKADLKAVIALKTGQKG